ncbi:MAG: hypothetical protein D6814_06025 [Calditrichaeota bacterium]|nr:MAG: hypothetical protein D6814_06025 [Calditrichota bacterium]
MKTITIQITHSRARKIIKELEALHLIRIIEENDSVRMPLSKKLAGKLPSRIAEQLQQHVLESREEWQRNI